MNGKKIMEEATQINGHTINRPKEIEEIGRENEELKNKLAKLIAESNHFTYIVSHDLQAPLRTINGFMDLLKKGMKTNWMMTPGSILILQ